MTLAELRDLLTEMLEDEGVDPETVVLFAHQPRYPLQCGVTMPVLVEGADEVPSIVYLAETSSGGYTHPDFGWQEFSPYAPRAAWE